MSNGQNVTFFSNQTELSDWNNLVCEYDGQEKMGGEDEAYHFMSGGPDEGEYYSGMEEEEMLDESATQAKSQILEMFQRISKF